MKNYGPTISAYLLLVISLIVALFINNKYTSFDNKTSDDVEIIIKKTTPVEITANKNTSIIKAVNDVLNTKLDLLKSRAFNVIDSYEYELAGGWREILNTFEYFEFFKSIPEAFIRRLIYMPTFTGRKDFGEIEIDSKPIIYPDTDYRSFKYRTSFVPGILDGMKAIVEYFYFRVKVLLCPFDKK